MKKSVHVPMLVKKCLHVAAGGALAVALAACSQPLEPKEVEVPVSPVVEEVEPEVQVPRKPVRPVQEKKVQPLAEEKTHVSPQPALQPLAEKEAPAPAVEEPVAVAPVVHPQVVVTPIALPSAPVVAKRIARVDVPGPYVAVTFDDGPSATLTPQVLDIFNRHGAHATFFVLGRNASRFPGLLARAVAEGHEVGSHSWSHINMRASSSETIFREFDRTNAAIEKATGSLPKVMRPPYGSVNPTLVNMVYKRYGTPAILWDVDTNDWRKPGVQTVINRAVGKARPGSIILLHDIHASTLDAVEGIVTGLQARGFKLVTVSELMALGNLKPGGMAPAAAPVVETPVPETTASPAEPLVEESSSPAPLHAQQQQHQPAGAAVINGAVAPQQPEEEPVSESVPQVAAPAPEESPFEQPADDE